MSDPAPRIHPTDTPAGPGIAAWSSLRHAWGTLATARARLEQQPPDWQHEQLAEADATLAAAQELIRSVGEAIRRTEPD